MTLSAQHSADLIFVFILQVHHLYQRALHKLPLCATLWKDVMFSPYDSV